MTALAVLLSGCAGIDRLRGSPNGPGTPAATPSAAGSPTAPTPSAAPTGSPVPSGSATSLSPPPASPAAALRPFYAQRLRWSPCEGAFSCAQVRVPIDYARPQAGAIALSVVRLPATSRVRRIGSLVVNPGGPGGSGVDYARAARSAITEPVRARFDIVGFDPRGVGDSAPVRCQNDAETDAWLAADASPDDAVEERRYEQLSRAFAQRCGARGGPLVARMGTREVARDLDVLRAALGDEELYFLGKSYGTYIGAVYAETFPARVGRLVLDGAKDPRLTAAQEAQGQAAGFERALVAFVDDCIGRSACPLPRRRAAALDAVRQLLLRIDRTPLPGDGRRRLTESLAVLGIIYPLYDRSSWGLLRTALTQALDGDGSVLLQIADAYSRRDSTGRYEDNSNDAIYAVNCLDRRDTSTLGQTRAQAAALRRTSPSFGVYLAWGVRPCVSWPAPATDAPHPVRAVGAKPILVVGTTRDPATPYAWAQGLAAQLESGVLLSYDGDGHTAYAQGSTCVDRAVEVYLLFGRPPAEGIRC